MTTQEDVHIVYNLRNRPADEPEIPYNIIQVTAPKGTKNGPLRTFKEMRWYQGTPNAITVPYELVPGADINIAINAIDAEFDNIVLKHFNVIHKWFPHTVLIRVHCRNPYVYHVISTNAPGVDKGFREVKMYSATWTDICVQAVGMGRLAYTAARDNKDTTGFYLTASCLKSAIDKSSPNYYYFTHQRSSPQDYLLRYSMLGYNFNNLSFWNRRDVFIYAVNSAFWNPSGLIGEWKLLVPKSPSRSMLGKFFNIENYY